MPGVYDSFDERLRNLEQGLARIEAHCENLARLEASQTLIFQQLRALELNQSERKGARDLCAVFIGFGSAVVLAWLTQCF